MSNPTPILNNINAFDATKGTIISFNIIGGTDIVRSNIVYIYDLSTNDLICTHLYISTESTHELPPNTDPSIVYASGKSSADFVNNKNYYLQIQTFTNTAGTAGGSGMSVAKTFWCLSNPSLSVNAIPAAISTTSYNVGATYTTNITDVTIPVTNIIQQYKFDLYTATGTLVQTSGNIIGSGEQEGTSTTYNITYNFSGLVVNNSYYVVVTTTSTEGMTVSAQSNTFTVSIETPTVGGAIVNNNACDGYISVVSNLSDEYGGHVSGEMASFETDSVNNVSSLKVNMEPIQEGSGTPSPTNIRPIRGHGGVNAYISPTQSADDGTKYSQEFDVSLTPTSTDKVPYTFKAVGRDVYGDRESDKIVGGTVAWNQLYKRGNSGTNNGIVVTLKSDGYTINLNGTATSNAYIVISDAGIATEYTTVIGHKYLVCKSAKQTGVTVYNDNGGVYMSDNANYTIGEATKRTKFYCRVSSGTTLSNFEVYFQIHDLTAMFGSTIADYIYSLEQATAGAGVAWFRRYFPEDYYPYDAGTLRSVEGVSAHETVGKNLLDTSGMSTAGTSQATFARTADGVITVGGKAVANVYRVIGTFQTIKDVQYTITGTPSGGASGKYRMTVGGYGYDYGDGYTFTGDGEAHAISIDVYTGYPQSGTLTFRPMIRFASVSDSTFEPYQKHTYPLDSSLTLRGVPKLVDGKLEFDGDIYPPSGDVQRRYGLRGYQSGDESLADAITDGTSIVYKLATPTTETAEPFTNPQVVDNGGTEAYVTTGIVPVGHDTTYLTRDIFGGTLDLVTGVLTVDRAVVDLGTLNWGYSSGGNGYFVSNGIYSSVKRPSGYGTLCGLLSSDYEEKSTNEIYFGVTGVGIRSNTGLIWIHDGAKGTDPSAFKTSMSGVQLAYPLVTPQTYQLTPHQIQTLVGQNNVWSDAGDVDITFNLPISNLLVKRQDASDVSGDWLTLYSQPIAQASDMDFTFIDFLNQHGKTYRYALVPLLTQQQGDIDVEVEGGYTVSDDVLSVFDGVFVANSNGSQKLKASTEYGDLETNQDVGVLTTIGNKYPFVVSNSNLNYHSGSISALIVPSDFYTNGDLDRLSIVERREAIEKFLTDKTAKILKDWNGNIWLITFVENVEVSFVDDYGMGLGTLSAKWVEIGDVNDQTDLKQTGLI